MLFEDTEGDEKVKVGRVEIGPETLPQGKHIIPRELSLVPDKQHAEEKEKVRTVSALEVQVQLRIHQLYEVVECKQLKSHARLIAKKVALLANRQLMVTPGRCIRKLTILSMKPTKPQKATASSCMIAYTGARRSLMP